MDWFKFHVRWARDARLIGESPAVLGTLVLWWCHQWEQGGLPDDQKKLAAIGQCTPELAARLRSEWLTGGEGTCAFDDMLRDQVKAQKLSSTRSKSGRKGGEANAKQMLKQPASKTEANASLEKRREEKTREDQKTTPPTPQRGKAKRAEPVVGKPFGEICAEADAHYGCPPGSVNKCFWEMMGCWEKDKISQPKSILRTLIDQCPTIEAFNRAYEASFKYRKLHEPDRTKYMTNPLTWIKEEGWEAFPTFTTGL